MSPSVTLQAFLHNTSTHPLFTITSVNNFCQSIKTTFFFHMKYEIITKIIKHLRNWAVMRYYIGIHGMLCKVLILRSQMASPSFVNYHIFGTRLKPFSWIENRPHFWRHTKQPWINKMLPKMANFRFLSHSLHCCHKCLN